MLFNWLVFNFLVTVGTLLVLIKLSTKLLFLRLIIYRKPWYAGEMPSSRVKTLYEVHFQSASSRAHDISVILLAKPQRFLTTSTTGSIYVKKQFLLMTACLNVKI